MTTQIRDVLSELANELKDVWTREFRRERVSRGETKFASYRPAAKWAGIGYNKRTGKKNVNSWLLGAEKLVKAQIPFAKFVHFVIYDRGMLNPTPAQLHSDNLISQFQQGRDQRDEAIAFDLEVSFSSQQATVRRSLDQLNELIEMGIIKKRPTKEVIQRTVLVDESLELTALFRYCLAVAENLSQVAERYEYRALLQYAPYADIYDRVWKDWIPERLRKHVFPHRPEKYEELSYD